MCRYSAGCVAVNCFPSGERSAGGLKPAAKAAPCLRVVDLLTAHHLPEELGGGPTNHVQHGQAVLLRVAQGAHQPVQHPRLGLQEAIPQSPPDVGGPEVLYVLAHGDPFLGGMSGIPLITWTSPEATWAKPRGREKAGLSTAAGCETARSPGPSRPGCRWSRPWRPLP